MAVQPQRVPCLEALTMSKHPSAQATSLEEVINCVNSSVEAIKKEFESLTSWLLHQGKCERKEKHGSISAGKVLEKEHGHESFTPKTAEHAPRIDGTFPLGSHIVRKSKSYKPMAKIIASLTTPTTAVVSLPPINRILAGQHTSNTRKLSLAVMCEIGRRKARMWLPKLRKKTCAPWSTSLYQTPIRPVKTR
jgi:hypothetical protein